MPGGEARAARGQHPEATQLRRDIFHRMVQIIVQSRVRASGHEEADATAKGGFGLRMPERPSVRASFEHIMREVEEMGLDQMHVVVYWTPSGRERRRVEQWSVHLPPFRRERKEPTIHFRHLVRLALRSLHANLRLLPLFAFKSRTTANLDIGYEIFPGLPELPVDGGHKCTVFENDKYAFQLSGEYSHVADGPQGGRAEAELTRSPLGAATADAEGRDRAHSERSPAPEPHTVAPASQPVAIPGWGGGGRRAAASESPRLPVSQPVTIPDMDAHHSSHGGSLETGLSRSPLSRPPRSAALHDELAAASGTPHSGFGSHRGGDELAFAVGTPNSGGSGSYRGAMHADDLAFAVGTPHSGGSGSYGALPHAEHRYADRGGDYPRLQASSPHTLPPGSYGSPHTSLFHSTGPLQLGGRSQLGSARAAEHRPPTLYGSTSSIVSAEASVPGGAWPADDLPFAMDEPEDLKTYMRKVDDAPPELEMFGLPAHRAADQMERLEAELSASAVELQQFDSALSSAYGGRGLGD